MKKKIIAISLITAMVICNSVTVLAADTWDDTGYHQGTNGNNADSASGSSGTKNVTATFQKANNATYSVTITWDDLSFKYTDQLNWTGSSYNGTSADAWVTAADPTKKMNKITITNTSDKEVYTSFWFEQDHTYVRGNESQEEWEDYTDCLSGVFNDTGTITDPSDVTHPLGTVADTSTGDAEKSVYFGVKGVPTNVKFTNDIVDNLKIGTVTITVSQNVIEE